MIQKAIGLGAGLLILGTLAGCGSGDATPEGMPTLAPVTVTVTQQGQPLAEATVVFAPKTGKWGASGVTDAVGQCQLRTLAKYEGVAEGQYLVSVTKHSAVDIPGLDALEDDALDAKLAELEAQGIDTQPKLLTPAKYSTPGQSGLEADVPAGGADLTFDLTEEAAG